MLTRKSKYGLKALVYLSMLEEGEVAMVSDIAAARKIPSKFLEAILVELRNAGYIASQKGRGGGHRLARPAGEIHLGSIIRVLDGSLAPIPCASRNQYRPCDDCNVDLCEVRRVMVDVRQAICDVLDRQTVADLRSNSELALLADLPCPD